MGTALLKKPKRVYEPILAGPKEWPVVLLSKNRKHFIDEVIEESIKKINDIRPSDSSLIQELEVTLYREKLRIKTNKWNVDPSDEGAFWEDVKKRLLNLSAKSIDKSLKLEQQILRDIVIRYAHEIAGNFKPSSYRFAKTLATFGFRRLLNASRIKKFGAVFTGDLKLRDKIKIVGETEQIRELAKIGTIVMAPTHFSNLDSILIGWVINELGLPPFIYGAGLNLFNIGIIAYFMNSLGAYKVDRRKKNLLYLETLKTYSTLAIQKGCHSLFFPGGTRSRSGRIEKNLKLGLLGTAMEAQRINYAKDPTPKARKVFIVPVVLNYHFVLEAPLIINDFLKREGQQRYYHETDNLSTSYNIIKFLIKFFTKGSDISVSIGKGMDLLGNYVDNAGNSLDKNGNIIEEREYFVSNGKVTANKQRESEYTRMLCKAIIKEFHIRNSVFASHLVAFVAFELFRKRYPQLDLFNFLRLPEEDLVIEYGDFKSTFKRLRKNIFKLNKDNKIGIAPHLKGKADEVIQRGLANVGLYHNKRPVIKNKNGDIITQDLTKLYYYHNRLDGYGLEKKI